jgi:ABC-type Mn2+/Zn2+ transport system ATPase subunit
MSETIISIKGLSVSYERKRVLANIYMDIEKGKMYAVVGPNGAGKSTFFNAILGLIDINSGQILFNNKPIETEREHIAYVPQRNEVDWSFPATVMDVVMMGRYPHKTLFERLNQKDRELAINALRELGIENLKNRQISELSGGQQQRTFIARALAQGADIYMLDEPFVGVDITTENKIIETLKRLTNEGKTVLVVHHDLSTVDKYFDKVILLNQRLIAIGDIQDTFIPENIANTYGGQLQIMHKIGLVEPR